MKVVLIDFRDSFTHNIAHYIDSFGIDCKVLSDGAFEVSELSNFDRIILSPGPGLPNETHSMKNILMEYHVTKPILGVCLGMQGITEFFGGDIYNLGTVKHGVQEEVVLTGTSPLYTNIHSPFDAGLYHSWACNIDNVPDLIPDAFSAEGVLMSFHHKTLPVFGIQYHPESILTSLGKQILMNFVTFTL